MNGWNIGEEVNEYEWMECNWIRGWIMNEWNINE